MRCWRGRAVGLVGVVCTVWLWAGCGGGQPEFERGKTKITGTFSVQGYMGVAFVPIVDGKPDPDPKNRRLWGVSDGRYEAWMPPGKYDVHVAGPEGNGPKVTEVEVGAEPMTLNIDTPPEQDNE